MERRKLGQINKLLNFKKEAVENQHLKLSEAYAKLTEVQAFKEDVQQSVWSCNQELYSNLLKSVMHE